MDVGTLVVAIIGAVGGGLVTGLGSTLRTRLTARTASRLIYAELTRNSAAVAYYRRIPHWPSATLVHTAWDSHGEALARIRDADTFDVIYRGYSALEVLPLIAQDSRLPADEREALLEAAVADLQRAIDHAGDRGLISAGRRRRDVDRLSPQPLGAEAVPYDELTAIGIISTATLSAIIEHGSITQRRSARGAATTPRPVERQPIPRPGGEVPPPAPADGLRRVVYDAGHTLALTDLPAVRREGDPPTGDTPTNEVYDAIGMTHRYFREVHGRSSLDGAGGTVEAVVHYGVDYLNVFSDGSDGGRLVCGDGDGELFNRFTACPEVLAHELCHVITTQAGLSFEGQGGALNEAICDIFGLVAYQYALGQRADEASWLVGAGLLAPGVQGQALRSLAAPGTAYDDPVLGKDGQPAHMDGFVRTRDDNGGIHVNSGIPGHAFYLLATTLGGCAWERAAHVWYDTVTGPSMSPETTFSAFAAATVAAAKQRFGTSSEEAVATRRAWLDVGVTPRRPRR